MKEIEELAHYFVVNVQSKSEGVSRRIEYAIQSIKNSLEVGWTIDSIREEIDKFKLHHPSLISSIYHIEEIIGNKQPPQNLMDPNIFYYHNELRITSKPVKILFNEEERRYERLEEAFFLEMKKAFTLQDLLDYWYKSISVKPNQNILNQDTGKFKHFLKYYDIDELLFMIDLSIRERKAMNLPIHRDVFQIEKFADKAKEAIEAKRSVQKIQGVNSVVEKEDDDYVFY